LALLSIIIPCYNTEKYIGKTIESIQNQSFIDWELIIVNDGSTDNSLSEITKYQIEDGRIQVYSIQNGGVNKARNFGYTKVNADSKYVHFMDSDDFLAVNFYDRLIFFLENNPDYGAAYCDHIFINEDNLEIEKPNWGVRYVPTRFGLKELPENEMETPFISIALWCKMVEPMVILRRKEFEKSKKWNESFVYGRIGEGVVLFSEIALESKIAYINEVLFYYRRHIQQSSQNSPNNVSSFSLTRKLICDTILAKKSLLIFKANIHRHYSFKFYSRLKHNIRYLQLEFIKNLSGFIIHYVCSFSIIFKNQHVFVKKNNVN